MRHTRAVVYTLAERMSVSGHKSESQYIKYIKCSGTRLPKWLLLQMTKMETTCSKKEGENLLFFIITLLKNNLSNIQFSNKSVSNVVKLLSNLGFGEKENLLNH